MAEEIRLSVASVLEHLGPREAETVRRIARHRDEPVAATLAWIFEQAVESYASGCGPVAVPDDPSGPLTIVFEDGDR